MTLTKKQKVLIPLLVAVLCVLGWQAYLLLNENNENIATENTPTAASVPPIKLMQTDPENVHTNSANNTSLNNASSSNANVSSNTAVASTAATNIAPVNAPNINSNNANIQQSQNVVPAQTTGSSLSQDQVNYLQLVNQYQDLQLQQMIAQTSQSIAEAKLHAAEARAKLVTIQANSDSTNNSNLAGNQQTNSNYQLVYTGKQNNRWGATLREGNQYIDVNLGSQLDIGTVTAISDSSVILSNGLSKTIITFYGNSSVQQTPKVLQKFTQNDDTSSAVAGNSANDAGLNQTAMHQSSPANNNAITSATKSAANDANSAVSENHKVPNVVIAKTSENKPVAKLPLQNIKSKTKETNKLQTIVKSNKQEKKSTAISNQKPTQRVAENSSARQSAKYSSSEEKILALNPKKYTIQMIADKQLSAIMQFKKDNNLKNTYYYSKKVDKTEWYFLIAGQYETAPQAQAALNNMSAKLQHWHPYIKRNDAVQAEVKKVG